MMVNGTLYIKNKLTEDFEFGKKIRYNLDINI